MSAQKIPLFGGMIIPVHNGSGTHAVPVVVAPPTVVASPPDKAFLPQGTQGTYEVHLWLKPGGGVAAAAAELYAVEAYLDSNPAVKQLVWGYPQANLPVPLNGAPVKILDGYPVRGGVTVQFTSYIPAGTYVGDAYPTGSQLFGYYYRVGQGQQVQPERRFIGEDSPDGIAAGVPIVLNEDERKIIHVFDSNRLDEMSLGFAQAADEATSGFANIRFEDVNNNLIIPNQQINLAIEQGPNFLRDPQSVYYINQVPFGGGYISNLDHIAVTNQSSDDRSIWIHGYFTRR